MKKKNFSFNFEDKAPVLSIEDAIKISDLHITYVLAKQKCVHVVSASGRVPIIWGLLLRYQEIAANARTVRLCNCLCWSIWVNGYRRCSISASHTLKRMRNKRTKHPLLHMSYLHNLADETPCPCVYIYNSNCMTLFWLLNCLTS